MAGFYGSFLPKALNKEIDFDSDGLKVMLCTSSYTPNMATHAYKSDVTNEVVGTGYTATGTTVGSASMNFVASNSWSVSRANSTAYALGYIVRPATGNGCLYMAISTGTSGGSIPTYPTTFGSTVVDGTVTWMCVSTIGAMQLAVAAASWASSTITARYAVLYDSTPATDATRPLIALVDYGSDKVSSGGTFQHNWDTLGVGAIPIPG